MVEPAYDAGSCTAVGVNNTDDVEWMKTCKLFDKRDYVFLYSGIVEKYRLDMAEFHSIFEIIKSLADSAFEEALALDPVGEGLP